MSQDHIIKFIMNPKLLIYFVPFSLSTIASLDYTTLVYKHSSNNTFLTSDPIYQAYSQTLLTLFQLLVSESSTSGFFKTISLSENDDHNAISGSFQCRGDLSTGACQNCVHALPEMALNLCKNNIGACRVQLLGCNMHYEPDGDLEWPKMWYKMCDDESQHSLFYADGEEVMNDAFEAVETGVQTNDGFSSIRTVYIDVMAQCDGDLRGCDCGECVGSAIQIARNECKNSLSGEIYMDRCFLSFAYYPNGVPTDLKPDKRRETNGVNNKTVKSVAIVVGGAAALCLCLTCLFFIKSLAKKDDDY